MIISSFRAQYGIKIHSAEFREMKWDEFRALLSGIGPDTPLGRIVQIRAEEDEDILKHFTKDQMRIRTEWRNRKAKKVTPERMEDFLEQMKKAFIAMAGGVNY